MEISERQSSSELFKVISEATTGPDFSKNVASAFSKSADLCCFCKHSIFESLYLDFLSFDDCLKISSDKCTFSFLNYKSTNSLI